MENFPALPHVAASSSETPPLVQEGPTDLRCWAVMEKMVRNHSKICSQPLNYISQPCRPSPTSCTSASTPDVVLSEVAVNTDVEESQLDEIDGGSFDSELYWAPQKRRRKCVTKNLVLVWSRHSYTAQRQARKQLTTGDWSWKHFKHKWKRGKTA